MGVRGFKERDSTVARNRLVWQAFLELKALNYYDVGDMYRRVAEKVGTTVDLVKQVVTGTDPAKYLRGV